MHSNYGFPPHFTVFILAFIILIRFAGAFFGGATTERKMGRPWPAELKGKVISLLYLATASQQTHVSISQEQPLSK